MKKRMKMIMATLLTASMVLPLAACGNSKGEEKTTETTETTETAKEDGEKTKIKITWWGGQPRHEYTQQLLDLYMEENPDVEFETVPSGWDGYFDKLSTQAASGSMPDIVQMDYLYISTYAQNNSVADLQEFIDDGTIDVSSVNENLLNTGKIDDKMAGMVIAGSYLSVLYNPAVFEEAGVELPTSQWTWEDFQNANKTIYEKTGKKGTVSDPAGDTNMFNYWVRQQGQSLFNEDNTGLGYDDEVCADYFTYWKTMMDEGSCPNPDEYAQIQTLGQEGSPIVKDEAGTLFGWNNMPATYSKLNANLEAVTPPLTEDNTNKGLWMKPGMFFSVSENSEVKEECAEFINWFINSEEANDIIMAERGTPVSSKIREYMVGSGKLDEKYVEMLESVDEAEALCGETPAPDPSGMAEINEAFKAAANSVFYGQSEAKEAAAEFREKAEEILQRNN